MHHPRGSVVIYESAPGAGEHACVLLTDTSTVPARAEPPLVGLVFLAKKGLPVSPLYPQVEGTPVNGLRGTWWARADKTMSVHAERLKAAGSVSGPELAAIDAAVKLFLSI